MSQISTNDYYNRLAIMMKKPVQEQLKWTDHDADYNIRSGLTFGQTETETIEKQHWDAEV